MKITTIGLDLAKNVFHLCVQDSRGHPLETKKLGRSQFKKYLATTPASKVVFESCATAHYWTRVANRYEHEVKLIHPAYVKPYLKTNKNDFNDAEAICEADSRPTMRYAASCLNMALPFHWVLVTCGANSLAYSKMRRMNSRPRPDYCSMRFEKNFTH